MHFWSFLLLSFSAFHAAGYALPLGTSLFTPHELRQQRSVSLPINRRVGSGRRVRRDGTSGQIGLGDASDLSYTVSIQLGNITTAVDLDTGSSDLWVISSACQTKTCQKATTTPYPLDSFQPSGGSVSLQYGDSTTGTHANGPVGQDAAVLAGIQLLDQQFAAINDTNNPSVDEGAGGIFGLGFPAESEVQEAAVTAQSPNATGTDAFISTISTNGPLLSRMAINGLLEQPMFAITLQRDTVDIGSGNEGQLTIGKLPDGVDNSSLTWVPVRLYSSADGGLAAPSFAENEIYPLRWEVPLDAVFLDGVQLPTSNITGVTTELSALIDTGNSIIRGPADVVSSIVATVAPSSGSSTNSNAQPKYPCATPHTLAFQIGGKQFPVDPRDFLEPSGRAGDTTNCVVSNVVSTDPPSTGALFSWSLGDTFLKSAVVAFYYGNLTNPSVDPPRMGFLSTVPNNASQLLVQAVQNAASAGGFPSTVDIAPSASIQSVMPQSSTPSTPTSAAKGESANSQPTGVNSKSNGAAPGVQLRTATWIVAVLTFMATSTFRYL